MDIDNALSDFFVAVGTGVIILAIFLLILIIVDLITKDKTPPKPSSLDQERRLANLTILKILEDYASANPSQRFGQILRNTGAVVDVGVRDSAQQEWETPDYYWMRGIHEEPMQTLARMEKVKTGVYEEIQVIERNSK